MRSTGRRNCVYALLFSVGCVLSACAASRDLGSMCPATPIPFGQTTSVVGDFAPAKPLSEVVRASSLIVIGMVYPIDDVVNTQRAVDDPARPDPTGFGIGQIYTVTVQQTLKGAPPTHLKIVQAEGVILAPTECVTPDTIAAAKRLWATYYLPFQPDTRYLLLLRSVDLSPPRDLYFMGSDVVWRWQIRADGMGAPDIPPGAGLAVPTNATGEQPIVASITQLVAQQR